MCVEPVDQDFVNMCQKPPDILQQQNEKPEYSEIKEAACENKQEFERGRDENIGK
jgi:hypothetical protein